MRPSLLPGLIAATQGNINRGSSDVALFEVGQVFRGDKPEDQLMAASGVRHGFASSKGMGRHWSGAAEADALDAKADAFAVLAAAGAPMQALQIVSGGPKWLHPGRSGTIQIGPQNVLGYFGELHPRTLEALGADGPLMGFEVILDRIPEARSRPVPSPCWSFRRSSRCRAISPSSSIAPSRQASSCALRRASTRS